MIAKLESNPSFQNKYFKHSGSKHMLITSMNVLEELSPYCRKIDVNSFLGREFYLSVPKSKVLSKIIAHQFESLKRLHLYKVEM